MNSIEEIVKKRKMARAQKSVQEAAEKREEKEKMADDQKRAHQKKLDENYAETIILYSPFAIWFGIVKGVKWTAIGVSAIFLYNCLGGDAEASDFKNVVGQNAKQHIMHVNGS